ncbi:ABC transporter substrate-binding protein [Microtetraspora malaysiensis]|uniref:ABC transporter substrate-binding protein n=1 Tax=Microtetraspora malaysiensis TaxID=161358 RepID=UPI003D8F2162
MTSATALPRVALAALLLLSAGCAGSKQDRADTLRWALSEVPNSLDIAHGFNNPSTIVQFAVLDCMVTLGKKGEVLPSVAESWTHPDPLTYVFTLREGVKFSDGSPVTAEDAVFSLSRHVDPKVASQAASYVTMVKKVEATGPRTVTVTLSRPNQAFLPTAALAWQIVPKKLAEAHPEDLGSPEVGTLGSGPFKVAKFSLTEGVTLERNPLYWGPKPALRKIELKTISDPETLRLAVSSGEADGTADVRPSEARKWTGLRDVTTTFYPADNIAFLSLAVDQGPLKDVHVRRAIAHAVDRAALVQLMTGGHGSQADLFLPKPQLTALYGDAWPALPTYAYDVEAAKAELAKSAYPRGFTLATPYDSGGENVKAMQAVAADLAKIGITLELTPLPSEKYITQRMDHEDLAVQMANLYYSTPDPSEVLPDLLSRASAKPQGFNFSGYGTAALDAELDDVGRLEGEPRREAITKVLAEVAEQVPYVPLYHNESAFALNKRFTMDAGTWTIDILSAVRPAGS